MSHPAQIKIINILSEMNICIIGDIAKLVPLAQSTVSQLLKELKRVGLIEGEVDDPKSVILLMKKSLVKQKKC